MSKSSVLPFRNQSKSDLGALVPSALRDRIRETAKSRRQSISMVASEALCVGLGYDPADFGIPSSEGSAART